MQMHLVLIQLVLIKRILMHVAYLSNYVLFSVSRRNNAELSSKSKEEEKSESFPLWLRMPLVVLRKFFPSHLFRK